MRRSRTLFAALVAIALAFGTGGCTDQTAEANKAIDTANVRIGEYTKAGERLQDLMGEAEALPMDATNAKKGIELTAGMKTALEEQRVAAEAARTEIAKIKGMKVRQEFKTYADKELAVTDALLKQTPVAGALVEDMRKIYDLVASGKGTQAQVEEIGKRIDDSAATLTALEAETAQREKDASDYFTAQKLGG